MAGGTFKLSQPKARPGTYVNIKNGKRPTAATTPRGIACIPLIGYDWGPRNQWIHLYAESPDEANALFGRSVYDNNKFMNMLSFLFVGANEIYVYITGGGKKATCSITLASETGTATAKYEGTRGNAIKIVSVANPTAGFDVSIILDGSEVELFEGVTKLTDIDSAYVDFTGSGNLTAFASATLTGGTDDDSKTNSSVSMFLDKSEKIKFNCMAFPTTEAALITALVTKIKYIRNTIGWKCQAIIAQTAADYEGIYNLVNSFRYGGRDLAIEEATAWVAGAVAGADYTTSLTYKPVIGAEAVVGEKNNEESEQSIKKGECFFSVDESGNVIFEYDINSKVTFTQDDPTDIHKGRPCRVYDTYANDLMLTFVPGRYDNNSSGWAVMEGMGKAILNGYLNDGAIQNVDLENDFVVDKESSSGDSTYINSAIQPVDSAEKYYLTTVAR